MEDELKILFIDPYASNRWASARGRSYWVEFEILQDSTAGPISAIVKYGGCEYVYDRDDSYFASVKDPISFRKRLLVWHERLSEAVENFGPENSAEVIDASYMRSLVDRIGALIHWAFEFEQQRVSTRHS